MPDRLDCSLEGLTRRLVELRAGLEADPLSNPVRRLAYLLSREIEAGALTLDDTGRLIDALAEEAAGARRAHARSYLAPAGSLADAIRALADETPDEASFRTLFERPLETIVFTGHPTFAMRPEGREALVGDGPLLQATFIREGITLDEEHREACLALGRAADAVCKASEEVLLLARERYADGFRSMLPVPVGLATWVGYDLDGRQDIGWPRIFLHRLTEKSLALEDYVSRLEGLGAAAPVVERLRKALARAEEERALFTDTDALATSDGLVHAANRLTAGDEGRLTSLRDVIGELRELAAGAAPAEAIRLLAVASLMAARGLGLGEIHFRLNAAQIRNAARALIPIARDADLFGHVALGAANDAIAGVTPLRVNFGSLSSETSSARRIVIAAAQILKHVDEDTPIRLLIAECENPVTVLTAIYLARRYGVAHRLDVCPLFETAKSFDRSGRILQKLLAQPAYKEQARRRGRVAIEAGFSDAGRFMGQVPATLAIERLHGQLAQEMEAQGLGDLEAVVFNTHGESMGRGGHPDSIIDRSRYAMSPWARQRFREAGVRLSHEISFQGGDGFSWFGSAGTSESVIAGLLMARTGYGSSSDDPFYQRTEVGLDFYNTIRQQQIDLFHEEAMVSVALGPGLALLPPAGSRKTKRQFERPGEEEISLRRIRAIAHNGSLQQVGYLANLHAGVGEAFSVEPEAYEELAANSDRFARIMRMVAKAAALSDMKTLIAYLKLYDGSFWATRPIAAAEEHLARPCGDLAAHLVGDRRYFAALELAARLRPGAIILKRTMQRMGFDRLGPAPANLDLLHAVRIALMQHMFLLGARLPTFARAGGFSRQEVLDEILALEVPSAVAQLREGFPQRADRGSEELFDEPADEGDGETGYGAIERDTIAPLERAFEQCRRISLAIAHHFGAHG